MLKKIQFFIAVTLVASTVTVFSHNIRGWCENLFLPYTGANLYCDSLFDIYKKHL